MANLLDNRIGNICAIVGATAPPILFLTGKTNFRNEIAKRQPYKQRPSKKPWHFQNITAYIKGKYDWRLVEGLEADDLMSIEQTTRPAETVIATRDKDLRQVPGWHYGWEIGAQPQFGPLLVSGIGKIELDEKFKLRGYGDLFFYAQCLTGDVVDTVPGLPKYGPIRAFEILDGSQTSDEAFKRVLEAYRRVYGGNAEEELLEQARLLNMSREFKDNKVLLWNLPTNNYKEWMDVDTGEITRTPRILS